VLACAQSSCSTLSAQVVQSSEPPHRAGLAEAAARVAQFAGLGEGRVLMAAFIAPTSPAIKTGSSRRRRCGRAGEGLLISLPPFQPQAPQALR